MSTRAARHGEFDNFKVMNRTAFFCVLNTRCVYFASSYQQFFFIITKKTSSPSIIQRIEHREVGTPNCISIFSFIRMISANVFHILIGLMDVHRSHLSKMYITCVVVSCNREWILMVVTFMNRWTWIPLPLRSFWRHCLGSIVHP